MKETMIIIDNRERNLEIIEALEQNNVNITFAQLPIGDYIISDRLCVERKTVRDFENSIVDARLFEQAVRLNASFEKAIVLIEGSSGDFLLNKNVILGTILKLYTEFNVQILYSSGCEETAYILSKLAEREQVKAERQPRLLGSKKAFTTAQWQTLILSSIPGIGPKLAMSLIKHFKTLKNVAMAKPEELMQVEKIGKKKAERIYEILNAEFENELIKN